MPKNEMTDERILSDLGLLFDGETLEILKGVLVDPDGELIPGDIARLSRAFGAVSARLDRGVKQAVLPLIEGQSGEQAIYASGDVEFQYMPPTTARVLDASKLETYLALKHDLSLEINADAMPEVYKESKRRAHVRLTFAA